MKFIVRILIVAMTTLGLGSCGFIGTDINSGEISPDQSKFKQDFSIGPIIEAHQELLIGGPRALSGMEAGPREPFIQSQEYITVGVDRNNASVLMQAIQSDIQDALITSGATILGGGGDFQPESIAYFSHSYREGKFYGVINIWGIRGEGTTLIIIVEITESMN